MEEGPMEEKIKVMLVAAALLFASVPGGADAKEREEAAVDPRGRFSHFHVHHVMVQMEKA